MLAADRRLSIPFAVLLFFLAQKEGFPQCSPGFIIVTGRVVDINRIGVHKANLDFFPNSFPTSKVLANPAGSDKTSSLGYYTTCVYPLDFYRITFNPLYPINTHLVGKEILNVDLHRDTLLPDVMLQFGQAITGQAADTAGNPIDSVKLTADNLVTQQRIYLSTQGNKTDTIGGIFGVGNYRIVIPNGIYRLRYSPLVDTSDTLSPRWRQMGVQLDTVKISGRDTSINVTIRSGLLVSGQIVDSTFSPQIDSLFDVAFQIEDTLARKKIFLPHNKSDSAGKFRVAAPPGVYDFLFIPPRDSHFVAGRERGVSLSADTSFAFFLNRGVLLTVNVRDSLGQPVPFANLDVNRLYPTPKKIFTPTDNSDAAGVIKVAVPPDSYAILVKPPAERPNLDTLVLPGLVKIFNDTIMDVILPGQAIPNAEPKDVRILDIRPNPFRPGDGQKMKFPVDMNSPSGNWDISITVFSSSGEIVFRDKKQSTGTTQDTLRWDGLNQNGEPVASGIYFCKIRMEETGRFRMVEKILKAAVIR